MKILSIDDFLDVVLLIGSIENVDDIEQSNKLYRLDVNFGEYGIKQICSGIKKYYTKEQLKGRQALFVFNLAPRSLMGLESNGMILTAQDSQGNLQLIAPIASVPNGTRLK